MVRIFKVSLFACLFLAQGCAKNFTVSQTNNQQYILNQQQPTDNSINALVKPYRDSLDAKVNRVLVTSEADLFSGGGRNAKPGQIAMGNFMVDACLTVARQSAKLMGKPEPDISIFTWGSIRGSLPKGEITLRHIYQLMPFENEMLVLTLNAAQTRTLLNHLAMNNNPIAGATIKKGESNQILINGIPLDETKLYRVLASDYLAFGGDNITVLKDVSDRYFCDLKVRDALVFYLEALKASNKTLVPNYEPRIIN
jgi:2',3'-cyclic-nucleotide 2'-phosphodiesterase (5'-nucleotidase family)